MVVAVPGALRIEWDQEELGILDIFQQRLELTLALPGTYHLVKKEAENWLKVAVCSRNSRISSGWLVNTWSSR